MKINNILHSNICWSITITRRYMYYHPELFTLPVPEKKH